jgi:hypothetical protein
LFWAQYEIFSNQLITLLKIQPNPIQTQSNPLKNQPQKISSWVGLAELGGDWIFGYIRNKHRSKSEKQRL